MSVTVCDAAMPMRAASYEGAGEAQRQCAFATLRKRHGGGRKEAQAQQTFANDMR